MNQPNILWITSHDTGRFLGCYGEDWLKTPNLDHLAGEGVWFTQNYCNSTPCTPARGCLMTGRYAHSTGLMGLVNRGWNLPDRERTIVDYLHEAGYTTYNFGGQHERRDPVDNHYHHLCLRDPKFCDDVTDDLLKVLSRPKAMEEPFYINCYFHETHLAFDRDVYRPCELDRVRVPEWIPDLPAVRREWARYGGAVNFLDTHIGRILDALETTGLRDNTLVIYTTDHGIAFPRAKSMLYDPGIGTALMMRFPDGMVRNGRYDEMVNHIDLVPTLLEMLGWECPASVQGRSYWPLLTGGEYVPNESIFAERNFHDDYDPMRCIRTERYKYIRNFQPKPLVTLPFDIRRSQASHDLPDAWYHVRPSTELYDLKEDPFEFHNLAGQGKARDVETALEPKLAQWMEQTNDPLLRLKSSLERLACPPEQMV